MSETILLLSVAKRPRDKGLFPRRETSWEAIAIRQGRDKVGLDWVAIVELVRTGYILKQNATGFVNVQYGECARKRGVKDDSEIFHLNK